MKKNHGKRIVLAVVLVVILGLTLSAVLFINNKLNKINYDDGTVASSQANPTDDYGNIIVPGDSTEAESEYSSLDESAASEIAEEAAGELGAGELVSNDDVINVLLIGTDTRERGGSGRSDAMIIATFNKDKKEIILTSLMRDMYVAIPGYGNTRLGHANAYGGPQLLLETIRENFRLDVTQYALVDFYSMADIIDTLGGVMINVEPGEVPYVGHGLEESGQVLLTGEQAVAYSRIRYYGGADFERTERQRDVLTALLNRFKGSSIGTLNRALDEVLPLVTTNMSKGTLLSYVPLLARADGYQVKQLQIPYNGSFYGANISGMDVLVPDIPANRERIHETLY